MRCYFQSTHFRFIRHNMHLIHMCLVCTLYSHTQSFAAICLASFLQNHVRSGVNILLNLRISHLHCYSFPTECCLHHSLLMFMLCCRVYDFILINFVTDHFILFYPGTIALYQFTVKPTARSWLKLTEATVECMRLSVALMLFSPSCLQTKRGIHPC